MLFNLRYGITEVLVEQLLNAYKNSAKLHLTVSRFPAHTYVDSPALNAYTAVQGHSLGGGLCTLAYGEFLRRGAEQVFAQLSLGDLYSFAAPRVCYQPFADEINRRTQPVKGGCSFRIVNKKDPVPKMPPPGPPLANVDDFPFIHVGSAWRITDNGPEKMDDEPPPVAPPPWDQLPADAADHGMSARDMICAFTMLTEDHIRYSRILRQLAAHISLLSGLRGTRGPGTACRGADMPVSLCR